MRTGLSIGQVEAKDSTARSLRPANIALASLGDASFDSHLLTAMADGNRRSEPKATAKASPRDNDRTPAHRPERQHEATAENPSNRRQTAAATEEPEPGRRVEHAHTHASPSRAAQSSEAPDRDPSPDTSEREDDDDLTPPQAVARGQASSPNQPNRTGTDAAQGNGFDYLYVPAVEPPPGGAMPVPTGGEVAPIDDPAEAVATATLPPGPTTTLPPVATPSVAADVPLGTGEQPVAADNLGLVGAQPVNGAELMPAPAGSDVAHLDADSGPAPEAAALLSDLKQESGPAAGDKVASAATPDPTNAAAGDVQRPAGAPTTMAGEAPPPAKTQSPGTSGGVVVPAAANTVASSAGAFDGSDSAGSDDDRRGGEPFIAATTTVAAANSSEKAAKPGILTHAVPEQVAVQIVRAARDGVSRLHVMLEPDALGRLEISLEIHRDGRVSALITADNPQTLDVLRGEARTLTHSLNSAGLKADQDSLTFAFRAAGDGAGGHGPGGGNGQGQPATAPALYGQRNTNASEAGDLLLRPPAAEFTGTGRLDIRA